MKGFYRIVLEWSNQSKLIRLDDHGELIELVLEKCP